MPHGTPQKYTGLATLLSPRVELRTFLYPEIAFMIVSELPHQTFVISDNGPFRHGIVQAVYLRHILVVSAGSFLLPRPASAITDEDRIGAFANKRSPCA